MGNLKLSATDIVFIVVAIFGPFIVKLMAAEGIAQDLPLNSIPSAILIIIYLRAIQNRK